jgi:ABC-type Fe3+-siderophore transport system permease subunit
MNSRARYNIRVEGAKYGASFGTALAIAISYTNNHSILWAIIGGVLSWVYVVYSALFRA